MKLHLFESWHLPHIKTSKVDEKKTYEHIKYATLFVIVAPSVVFATVYTIDKLFDWLFK